jgi:hypothetical protein
MAEKRRTIYEDQTGGEWCYERPLRTDWGEKKAAFRSLVDGVLDSEETEAFMYAGAWTVDYYGDHLTLTKTSRTFLDEGW